MFENIKKNYRIINIVFLVLAIYIALFPFTAKVLEKISPTLTKCPYLSITGKPCPLCGGTRYFANIKNVLQNYKYLFNFFGIVVILLILEIVYRIFNLLKKEYSDMMIKIDIIIHILLFICYTIYEIWYIINT